MSTLAPETAPTATVSDWKTSLPSELATDPNIATVPDVKTLAKIYVDQQKYIGTSIRIPTDDAPPEEKEKFHVRLGRPASVDKYSKLDTSQLPQGYSPDENRIKAFYDRAFKSGLTDTQAKEVLQWLHSQDIEVAKSEATEKANSQEQAVAQLKEAFGPAFDERLNLARRAYKSIATDDIRTNLAESGLEDNPAFIMLMAEIGKKLIDDRTIDGSGGVSSLTLTSQEALARISEINQDKSHPYHKGRSDAVAEMTRLFEAAYPRGAITAQP
jgi:hypothetical protein